MQEININVTETGCQRSPLLIGYQGENEVTRVIVDYSVWTEEFGAGSLTLEVMRSGDEIPYLAPLTIADGKAVWLVSNVDTGAEGVGAAGFVYTVGDQIKKSAVFRFFVGRDIGGDPGERPDPYEGVIAHIEKLVKEAEDNAAAAETAQTAAEASRDAAASSATDAAGSATTASQQAQAAATARAAAAGSASNAASSATSASGSATAARGSATAAANSATEAETAQEAAETAQEAAETAQEAAEQAKSDAETAAQSVSQSAAQIGQNASDISDLKSAVNDPDTGLDTKAPAIYDAASGTIASFEDGADGMPLKQVVVNIEPVQEGSGDPSPENVRPITGWTGCNVTRTGKNLFDKNLVTSRSYIDINGDVHVTSSNYFSSSNFIPVIPGTQIARSGAPENGSAPCYAFYDKNKNFIDGSSHRLVNAPSITITVPSGAFWFRTSVATAEIDTMQIEEGSTATLYEPFGTTYPITFPASAGTVYGGTLDVVNKKLTVNRAAVDLGSLTWDINDSWGAAGKMYSTSSEALVNAIGASGNSQKANIMCSHFAVATRNELYGNIVNDAINLTPLGFFQLRTTTNYDTVAEVKAAMDGVSVVYMLKEPIVYDLTDIPEITTLYGTNNIWADCGPVSVDYPADTKLFIQKVNKPTDDDMIADTQIASGKYFLIGNTLYFSTTIIPAGDTIIPGTNCTKTDLAAALNALNT